VREEGDPAAVGGSAEQPEVGIDGGGRGTTLLANVPTTRCTASSTSPARSRRARSGNSSPSSPEIRSRRLAFNRGVTFADAFAVATPLLAADGSLIAAISAAADDPVEADSLDDLGEELKKAIATLGPDTASAALNKLSSERSIRLGTLTSLAAAGVYPNVAQEP
jgi:hypothetical protein